MRPRRVIACAAAATIAPTAAAAAAFPNGPFRTSGRWILGADGTRLGLAGVNWPGAGEAMIPEGLQHASAAAVAARIRGLGMNAVRLTYATQMVDQMFDASSASDVPARQALVAALGRDNGTAVWGRVRRHNPGLADDATRLQVFDAVAAELARQGIYVVLDNHVSRAQWCCSPLDGNSWWGDTYFSTANWTRGLAFMAEHAKQWPNLLAVSLRNELRQPLSNLTLFRGEYDWGTWYARAREGAAAVHGANPDALVLLSGLDSDTTLQPVVEGAALGPGGEAFDAARFFDGAAAKLVLELHSYANIVDPGLAANCTALRASLLRSGWSAAVADDENNNNNSRAGVKNQLPVLMTEFGWGQNSDEWSGAYATCLRGFLADDVRGAGWMMWAISGSYYVREGRQDYDEPWGLLNHDWSDWRDAANVQGDLRRLVNITLSAAAAAADAPSSAGNGNQPTKSAAGRAVTYTTTTTVIPAYNYIPFLFLVVNLFFIM